MRRRHPSPLELGAYFDGEPIGAVAEHVGRCRRCREALGELHGVRSAVRGELDLTDGSARRRARWTVALIPVAASVALLLAMAAPPGGLPITRVQNSDEAAVVPAAPPNLASTGNDDAPSPPPEETGTATDPVRTPPAAPAGAAGGDTGAGSGPPGGPGTAPGGAADAAGPNRGVAAAGSAAVAASSSPERPVPPSGPLRLGVPVPTRGPYAGEGAEVLRAVRAVAGRANDAGGVAGRRVVVVPVPVNDDDARADALSRVDVLVGGYSVEAPAGMPWVMPADVGPTGPDVLAAELAAEEAGVAIGRDLVARGDAGRTIGAIVAAGPEAGLAIGLARSVPVHTVEAGAATRCDREIVALRRREVAALALAVPPDLVRRCAIAAARMGWRPAGGLLLAPSAVYAHLERDLVTQGARSALALATPSGDSPGSTRFRRSAPGCDSHRSLVSFAAAELALAAAGASNGVLTMSSVRERRWQSDLFDVEGGRHRTAHVVAVRFGRWIETTRDGGSSPGMHRGVVLPGDLLARNREEG